MRDYMDNEKDLSLSRTKKTATCLTDILLKEGAGAAIPGGGLAYSLGKLLVTHVSSWYSDRGKSRLEEFHQELFEGIPEDGQQEFMDSEFSIDEYYATLNHVIQDEEDTKVKIYAKIFQGLQLNLIPDEFRLHLIKCSRELKYSDFDLIRELYINEKYEFKAPGNKLSQINAITVSDDPIKAHSIQTLIRWGFLSTIDSKKPPWPTQLLKFAAEFLYDDNYLTAESLGKEAKTAETEMMKVYIACDNLGDNQISGVLYEISNSLAQADIKNVIINPIRKSLPLMLSPIVAICQTSKGNPFEKVEKFTNLDHKTLIQLILPGGKEETFPKYDVAAFDFRSINKEEIQRLIEFVKSKTRP